MELSVEQRDALLKTLKTRFEKHKNRHPGMTWGDVLARLDSHPAKLASLWDMEQTGGEPDVIGRDESGAILFCDCAPESPKGRRSLCFDREALESRKDYPPESSALDMAEEIGVELLNEDQYRALQQVGEFDTKTSSWIATPPAIRALGGALFADRRYNHIFVYHNGAQSYYAARGFRGLLRV